MADFEQPADNPFDAPKSAAAEFQPAVRHYGDASKGQRFANLMLDYVGFMIFAMFFGVVIAFVWPDLLETDNPIFDRLFGWFIMIGYYVVLEGITGRTLGKLITGTMVVDEETDERPTVMQIVGRSFSRLVPFEPFSFLGHEPTGWHDRWSGTRVVRLRPSKENYADYQQQDHENLAQ